MLVLIVLASGCTSQQNTSKTYSANGVTFNYPGSWSEVNSSSVQSQVGSLGAVLATVGNSDSGFTIAKLNVGSNQILVSLNEWASTYNNSQKSQGNTYVSENSTTVDGVNAYYITFKSNGTYFTDVAIIKNSNGYIATYVAPNNEQQDLQLILNSLKIT
jgi:hypothetical protein